MNLHIQSPLAPTWHKRIQSFLHAQMKKSKGAQGS